MINIALDAMGGDHAPDAIIAGALDALNLFDTIHIHLVGQTDVIASRIGHHPRITLHDAPDVILMDEAPVDAYRRKKNSSIHVGLRLVKDGVAQAFLSAGNTGAIMSASLFILGRIAGVDRPALASYIPTKHGRALMLDMGSTMDSKPQHLEQFAVMGHFFLSNVGRIKQPRVGMVNVGEEEKKGNLLTQDTHQRLKRNPLIHFIGNVEGRDIFFGEADVVVCDGFTGNTLLKFGEGLVEFFMGEIKDGIQQGSWRSKLGGLLLTPVFRAIKKRIDYEEYGSAPLLGINGVSLVAHGKSKQKAIVSAIRTAIECVDTNMIQAIETAFQTNHDAD